MKTNMTHKLISTVFYTGKVKFAPGTFGTFVAFLTSLLLLECGYFFEISSLIAFITFFVGWYSSDKYSKYLKIDDPKEIVIDEYCGYFLSCAISYKFVDDINFYFLIANFALFRVSDIIKPYPICTIDKKIKNGLGIMLDDVVAGIFSAIAVIAIHYYCSYLF